MLKHRSKLLPLLIGFLFIQLFSVVTPAAAAEVKDLASCSSFARPAVERLVQEGILSGDQNGYFNPKSPVTRGQMITIIVRSLELNQDSVPAVPSFKDVPSDHWANQYVETALEKGIAAGISSDEFGVDAECTREQMAAMFVRSFSILDPGFVSTTLPSVDLTTYNDNQKVSSWAKNSIGFSLYSGLLYGTTSSTISPDAMATREQAAVLVDRFLNRKDTIIADRQALALLEQASTKLQSAASFASTSDVKCSYTLWSPWLDLPGNFDINVSSIDEIVWPDSLHSKIRMEADGLTQDQIPDYEEESYLKDNIIYENSITGSTVGGWKQYAPLTTQEVQQVMNGIRDSLSNMTETGLEAHRTGLCTVEDAVVNGGRGYKITYTGNINDLSTYLNGSMSGLLSQYSGVNESIQEIMSSFTSASYTQIFYVSAIDGRLYGIDLTNHIDCKQTANPDVMPIKSMDITLLTSSYKYDTVSITVPDEAKNSPTN